MAGGGLTGGEHAGDAVFMHSQAEVENSMAILGKKKMSIYREKKVSINIQKKKVSICSVRQRWKTA
jgi:hypothetical protein